MEWQEIISRKNDQAELWKNISGFRSQNRVNHQYREILIGDEGFGLLVVHLRKHLIHCQYMFILTIR